MYCEYCGKATDGGRCAACRRRPARLSLNVFALMIGWLAIAGLYFYYAFVYPWAEQLFKGLGVELPLPTRLVAVVGAPFGSGWVAGGAAIALLLLAIALRRMRRDRWLAAISVLLVVLQVTAAVTVGMVAFSMVRKLR